MKNFIPTRSYFANHLHIQGDFVVFGYGGLYQTPKGFGLDICYLNRKEFLLPFGLKRAEKKIMQAIATLPKAEALTDLFTANFIQKLYHIGRYEWAYEKARMMFEYGKALPNQFNLNRFKAYQNFVEFAAQYLGNSGKTPFELEAIVKAQLEPMVKGQNIDRMIEGQRGLIARHAEDVVKRALVQVFSLEEAKMLLDAIKKKFQGAIFLGAENFRESVFASAEFTRIIADFHYSHIQPMLSASYVRAALRLEKVKQNRNKAISKARADTKRAILSLPKAFLSVLKSYKTPLFIATDENANFFSHFFTQIPLYVAPNHDELQEYTVFGLSMHQPYHYTGIIITHGGRKYPRFWHTLTEEITHLADGSQYSTSTAFDEAYQKDRANIPSWNRTGILGAKEWAMTLTQRKVSALKRQWVQKRIEQYEATLAFDHYPADERAAEIFAALPIIEKAVGRRLARQALPNLFRFYDEVFLRNLKKDLS